MRFEVSIALMFIILIFWDVVVGLLNPDVSE